MEKTHVAYSALGVGTTHGEDTSRDLLRQSRNQLIPSIGNMCFDKKWNLRERK